MRGDEEADFLLRYPFLNEDPVYRPATKELFTTAQNSLAKRLHNIILQQNEVRFSNISTGFQSIELFWPTHPVTYHMDREIQFAVYPKFARHQL